MTTMDRRDVRDTCPTPNIQTRDTTTAGDHTERKVEADTTPYPRAVISYRLIRTTASAFPIYVDANAPSPYPPTLSPLIDGTSSVR